ncbi:hypothetical protein VF21_03488 [Pseudogymnoascus sp. 05NY08]|nr:hypothetical protein VF21_03488 [Pseudogymnoascus sp. 05NY08]
MAEESKLIDTSVPEKAPASSAPVAATDDASSGSEDDAPPSTSTDPNAAPNAAPKKKSKKKRSKKDRLKAAVGLAPKGDKPGESSSAADHNPVSALSKAQLNELLLMNPALAREVGLKDGEEATGTAIEALKKLSLQDIMTGLAASGKNAKDIGSYKFWQTQPVRKFGDTGEIEEGPFKVIDPEKVPKEPATMMEGFEWVTMDLEKDEELQEVFDLLNGHYVEDEESTFRFNYSKSFLKWALQAPGWRAEWHVGVRASKSRKLVAFISGVPVALRVRQKVLKATEINFLCIHKKLRAKRLTPVLIKEITRRCYLLGIFQAIYTGGVVLPTPVSTCRYFHRSLDWMKLYEVGFSPLPAKSKPSYQVSKYRLPENTSTKGLRPMEARDIDAVLDLLKRYLARFDMAPVFTREEVEHWLLQKKPDTPTKDQVVWSYVVEDPQTKKITDYFSFYSLESTVIDHPQHEVVRAAYLFYYATETGLTTPFDKPALKVRLNALMNDCLILAKRYKFDVFNSLTLMDNVLFLEDQKFGKGDGQLHYYLYNYNANPIAGGVDRRNEVDEAGMSGIGVAML